MMNLLWSLGKTALRPGGVTLTRKLLDAVPDFRGLRVVELGAGVGTTARLVLDEAPASYVAVEPDPRACAELANLDIQVIQAYAQGTGLPDDSTDLVILEAFLTSLEWADKQAVTAEIGRILAPGGTVLLHEYEVVDALPYQGPLLPLNLAEWTALLDEAAITIEEVHRAPLGFIERERIIADEGQSTAEHFFRQAELSPDVGQQLEKFQAMIDAMKPRVTALGLVCRG